MDRAHAQLVRLAVVYPALIGLIILGVCYVGHTFFNIP